ncbi:hypothetical protein PUNSTDRAFT_47999 [Punctularia strigosozonata HHB-11173 SS5]|uniref:High-temperature-induced dauer-formation protein-domain-containing protein n=1 Tax=Punctularia strigosozonata (strain HHB-11173) TaxID=741275 RepID=R7S1F5_PUNST|nr:uncharacterized protein PUNSTDRAFT_47999 [Punctularia strigosozonata HHB-11173 SS5]EIN03674.1 hypothetical protein PUNSTDRAFT_47999 [Punctularia strigosozonata HHB-11173 SS5]
MFAKLPQSLPFGKHLLPDEAKLAFRSQPSGIAKLATTRNIPATDSYWDQYVTLFDSASEVYSLITANDLRRALLAAPENIATLIRVICSRLFNLVSDHTFPTPPQSAAFTFIKSTTTAANSERNTTKEALNCVRVLQRVFPVVFEVENETSRFEMEVLWKKEVLPYQPDDDEAPAVSSQTQFVIEDDDSDDEEGGRKAGPATSSSSPPPVPPKKAPKTGPSLAERLFSCIIDLLFCCGFTLPTKIQHDHYKINYVIWEKGVGSTVDPGPSHQYDANKTEVLRLLLVLLSREIYVAPAASLLAPSFYTLHFVQQTPRRDVLTVLCSLLNTCLNAPATASGMAAIGAVTGKLPYNHLVFKGEDPRTTLVSVCFQILVVLLDFQSATARDVIVGAGEQQTSAPTVQTNAFRYFLAKLHRIQDFEFILHGIVGILEEQMASYNNLLPGSRKGVPYIVETVVFFWKMIELNKKFRAYLLNSDKAGDVLAYLLTFSLEIKDKPQQHGLCRALSYIIQTLSAERAFGMKLTTPMKTPLPAKYNAQGTLGDFMITAIYAIVATTSGALNSIYPALIIALSNAAPYFKGLSVTASTRLVQLFNAFANPTFLLSDEGHPRLLYFMLEVFNSVILHNLSDNPNLVYAILVSHKTFQDLGTFTLARGLREVRRVQLAKEEQAKKAEGDAKGKGRGSGEAHVEKARLLERESQSARQSEENLSRLERQDSGVEVTRPLMSPTSGEPPASRTGSPARASEKARGKMRERRSISMDSELERIASAGVGRNGFVPTQEWVTSWQQGLPLDPVMLLISELLPRLQDLQTRSGAKSSAAITDFLSSVNLSHVLPPPPPINPRRFVWSDASIIWLTSLIWGEIYVRGMTPLGIWNNTNVRLFYVKHSQQQPRQLTETVTNVVGGLLGRGADTSQR